MMNDSAMNDTYSRYAAVHSFPPSPGRGTRNGVPVGPQQLSSSVFCSLLTGRRVGPTTSLTAAPSSVCV